ncbi:CarD family transcriptional regulator [Clostridium aminobutyricum]|uniref:CarD family transcriptional regulator n=1 Tax=Clostridium aminobutyricum TaxID=33953 RepID=A0A939IJK9_CLOAM|nr:CarD family transcriptional regulator [Clostridium aminobutyricum]MBN7774206.1 CarD family transcriptional regulator [Clostridium aminobutyricum]
MYQQGDFIIYGSSGVCHIEEVCTLDHILMSDKDQLYYKLAPIYDNGVIYTPINTAIFIRAIITKQQAEQLVSQITEIVPIPEILENVCDNHNVRALSDLYEKFLQTYDPEKLLQIIKTVHIKNSILIKNSKQLGQTDQKYMKQAEAFLFGELAVALEISYDDLKKLIEEGLSTLEY